MSRNYTAVEIVTLPRTDASNTVVLVRSLETAARGRKGVPRVVTRALGALLAQCARLEEERAARLGAVVSSSERSMADKNIDNAYAALFAFLTGWAKLSSDSARRQTTAAKSLLQVIFPDGLKFTLLPYREEWAESQARLLRIEREGLEADFAMLGGTVFLESIRSNHDAYGEALGITELATESAPSGKVGEMLQSTLQAMRTYVVKVIAQIESDDPATQELADALLQPLSSWKSTRTADATDVVDAADGSTNDPNESPGVSVASVDPLADTVVMMAKGATHAAE